MNSKSNCELETANSKNKVMSIAGFEVIKTFKELVRDV